MRMGSIPAPEAKIEATQAAGAGLESLTADLGVGGRLEGGLEKGVMPGVVMEDGSTNGAHTNHDRDPVPNGTNGTTSPQGIGFDKNKPRGESQPSSKQSQFTNGANGTIPDSQPQGQVQALAVESLPSDMAERVSELPHEIVHITEGFEPLSRLLIRLAQVTHNRLSAKIMELAAVPAHPSATNGNSIHYSNGTDDNSTENVRKKVNLLKFAEATHAEWTKALVITQWSRVSEDVSKVIDLKVHLDNQKRLYDAAFVELMEVKRGLVHARVPNPDLRTAVDVLSTGKASWMPDLGYIDPPPLTAKELSKSLQDLNTLLSIRLNLHEYDKMPLQFKNYTIGSGRVTFKVPSEFEVDLTIEDEDPEKQFWFIDFRFLFTPAMLEIPEQLRYIIESRVNSVLQRDGLAGCYKFLHELVLTHKISEIRRQAFELSKGKWIETLQVEPLHRALSIQYWLGRYGKDGPRSWILLGVESGKRKDGLLDPKSTSQISLRWFRDSKEVKDHGIILDLTSPSAEAVLQVVISKHISHILESTYKTLRAKPLFSNKQLSISLKMSSSDPKEPELRVQLTRNDNINITIEPRTGCFAINPALRLATRIEIQINSSSKDPAAAAHEHIENLRCIAVSAEIINRARSVGWEPQEDPGLKSDDLKPVMPRDTLHLSWFRRAGWIPGWFTALSTGMSGERWWLVEIDPSPKITNHLQIPLGGPPLNHTYTFLSGLHLFAAALLSHHSNLRALHERRAMYMLQNEPPKASPSIVKLPAIFVKLSDILPSKNKAPRTGKAWAKNVIKISFQGLASTSKTLIREPLPGNPAAPPLTGATGPTSIVEPEPKKPQEAGEMTIVIAEACLLKPMPPSLDLVKQRVDKDIAFHPISGAFAFRLYSRVGESTIVPLVERLQRVEQLVDFIEVVKKHEKTLHCETVSLSQVIFSYGASDPARSAGPDGMIVDSSIGKYRAIIDFSNANGLITIAFEPGNPQIRILDHLTKILNSPVGLNGVATLLPLTLPLMAAFDAIEDAWTPIVEHGDVVIFNRSMDWHVLRYNLTWESHQQQTRKVMFQIRLQHRRGHPWWCVRRQEELSRGEQKEANFNDDVDIALKAVWEDNPEGESWRGMQTSGIARVDGIQELMRRVDNVVRSVVMVATKSVPNLVMEPLEKQQLIPPGIRRDASRQVPQHQNAARNGKRQHEAIVIDD